MVELSPKGHKIQIAVGIVAVALIFGLLIAIPFLSETPKNKLQLIKQSGVLKVLTLNGASTFYEDVSGENGFEYQLANLFAQRIGVKLELVIVDRFANIYPELAYETGDIAAAGLSEEDQADFPLITYSPSYYQTTQQLIYRKDQHARPRHLGDIDKEAVLQVIDGSSHVPLIQKLSKQYPDLNWKINKEIAAEELIEQVDEGLIDFALTDSHEIALQRRFYPQLRIAFELGKPRFLRWAMKGGEDQSLIREVGNFFNDIKKDGRLDQLIHRYYSHVENFNYSDIQTFNLHLEERLPQYRQLFIREAAAVGMDWRLLAAIGYQESLWNPRAKSPTGVRGLMMLTLDTAKQMKIKNRLDPEQSIRGGARYFQRVLGKIPERIAQPDRNWLALASYNVGFGHLEDARILTQKNGGDPDKWIDIKKHLPLLGKKKYYKQTRHGYARGWEPVKYVENIRKYYDLLVGFESRRNTTGDQAEGKIQKMTLPRGL